MNVIHLNEGKPWEENVDRFFHICHGIKRPGIVKLLDYVVKHTDYFRAPASTRFHSCFEGGLLAHSLYVYDRLLHLMMHEAGKNPAFTGEEADKMLESIALVALFHDLCKTLTYVVSSRNAKNEETGAWEKVAFYEYSPKLPFGHGEKSVILLERFIKLTAEETTAILYHMGDYNSQSDMSFVYNTNPLAVMLHTADMMATYIDEACVPEKVATPVRDRVVMQLYEDSKQRYAELIKQVRGGTETDGEMNPGSRQESEKTGGNA